MADDVTTTETTSTQAATSTTSGATETTQAQPPATTDVEKTVPYDRFRAVNEEKKALAAQIAELSGKAATVEQLQSQLAEMSLQLQRTQAATDAGLPAELLPYVQGKTPDEMKASATFLATRIGKSAPNIGATDTTQTAKTYTIAQISDPTFYNANKQDILLAQREGRIG